MKIAVFHNFMDNIGGAEIVTLTLARGLHADVYTTNVDGDKISKLGFTDVLPRIHSLGRVPVNAPFRHQSAFWKFRKLDLGTTYDFYIIAGDWAMSGAVNNKPNLWYVHSPLNELWQWKDYIRNELLSFWKRPLFDVWAWFNRKLTLQYAEHVDIWISNSRNSKDRIKRYYGKEARIIYPPVATTEYAYRPHKNYWLSVNRLLNHKRIDLQLKAFAELSHERLIIVGSYEKGARQFEAYRTYIEKIKPDNVEILHFVDDTKLKELYAECKGFIATARDEDFGMTPVEAMASGKPVIAPNEGGYTETIKSGITGILVDDMDEPALIRAITELGQNPEKYKDACLAEAKRFDAKVFLAEIEREIRK